MPIRTNPETKAFARQLRRQLTEAEIALWQRLRRGQLDGVRFRRQVPIGTYVADFACLRPRIVLELDGGQHGEAMAYDAARSAFFQRQGFRVLRFWNYEIFSSPQGVLDTIWSVVADAKPRMGK